jgi:hypothetical protein
MPATLRYIENNDQLNTANHLIQAQDVAQGLGHLEGTKADLAGAAFTGACSFAGAVTCTGGVSITTTALTCSASATFSGSVQFTGAIASFSSACTVGFAGAVVRTGTAARLAHRAAVDLSDADNNASVDADTYFCAVPTAQRSVFLLTTTAPIPVAGEEITVVFPATGNFAINVRREGSAAAIVSRPGNTWGSATMIFKSGVWRLKSCTESMTPGAEA